MYSSPGARKSMDTISSMSPPATRTEFPFHKLVTLPGPSVATVALTAARQGQAHTYHTARRGSTASSIHSIGGSLDTSSSSWANAVLESGQNGITDELEMPMSVLTSP